MVSDGRTSGLMHIGRDGIVVLKLQDFGGDGWWVEWFADLAAVEREAPERGCRFAHGWEDVFGAVPPSEHRHLDNHVTERVSVLIAQATNLHVVAARGQLGRSGPLPIASTMRWRSGRRWMRSRMPGSCTTTRRRDRYRS